MSLCDIEARLESPCGFSFSFPAELKVDRQGKAFSISYTIPSEKETLPERRGENCQPRRKKAFWSLPKGPALKDTFMDQEVHLKWIKFFYLSPLIQMPFLQITVRPWLKVFSKNWPSIKVALLSQNSRHWWPLPAFIWRQLHRRWKFKAQLGSKLQRKKFSSDFFFERGGGGWKVLFSSR